MIFLYFLKTWTFTTIFWAYKQTTPNIRFLTETEKKGVLPFLNMKIYKENEKVVTSVHKKDTFSGVSINFTSFIPFEYKFDLSSTRFHCSVCSWRVTYAFQSESTLYSCLNVKELNAQNRRDIWSLSDCKSLKLRISHLFRARSSLIFRQL